MSEFPKVAIDRKEDGVPWIRDMRTGDWIAQIPDIEHAQAIAKLLQSRVPPPPDRGMVEKSLSDTGELLRQAEVAALEWLNCDRYSKRLGALRALPDCDDTNGRKNVALRMLRAVRASTASQPQPERASEIAYARKCWTDEIKTSCRNRCAEFGEPACFEIVEWATPCLDCSPRASQPERVSMVVTDEEFEHLAVEALHAWNNIPNTGFFSWPKDFPEGSRDGWRRVVRAIAGSPSGRTAHFDCANDGSSPSPASSASPTIQPIAGEE